MREAKHLLQENTRITGRSWTTGPFPYSHMYLAGSKIQFDPPIPLSIDEKFSTTGGRVKLAELGLEFTGPSKVLGMIGGIAL